VQRKRESLALATGCQASKLCMAAANADDLEPELPQDRDDIAT
jgi:hypothetical protein